MHTNMHTNFFKGVISTVLCALVLSPLSLVHAAAPELSDVQLRSIIERGTAWLVRSQEKSGHFRYEYLPFEGRYRNDDNIVRQAGALYQLGEIERFDTGARYNLEKTMLRGIGYFESLTVSGSWNGTSFRCIREERAQQCKLGTTALAMIGMLSFVDEYPKYEKKYRPLIHDYAAYILAMKKENAGFRYYFNPARKTQKDDESSFSNGEAFLALARYDAKYPSEKTKQIITDTFDYLSGRVENSSDARRQGTSTRAVSGYTVSGASDADNEAGEDFKHALFDAPLYLWVMAGLKDLEHKQHNDAYVNYAKKYTAWRLADNAQYARSTQNRCAYIEGLASAYSVLEGHVSAGELAQIRTTVDAMLVQTSLLQIAKEVPVRYVMGKDGKGEFLKLKNPKLADGGFLTGSEKEQLTQRIDYTQHCLSAYAQTLVDIRGGSL